MKILRVKDDKLVYCSRHLHEYIKKHGNKFDYRDVGGYWELHVGGYNRLISKSYCEIVDIPIKEDLFEL